MSVKLFRVIVLVPDIDRGARFYAALLGESGERIAPNRHYFDCDGTILACVDPAPEGGNVKPAPNVDYLYFACDDVAAMLAKCREAGGKPAPGNVHDDPAGEVVVRPWGERSVYLNDPFGNNLCFVERGTEFTGGGV